MKQWLQPSVHAGRWMGLKYLQTMASSSHVWFTLSVCDIRGSHSSEDVSNILRAMYHLQGWLCLSETFVRTYSTLPKKSVKSQLKARVPWLALGEVQGLALIMEVGFWNFLQCNTDLRKAEISQEEDADLQKNTDTVDWSASRPLATSGTMQIV